VVQQQLDFLQEETLLRYYADEWYRYAIGANYVNHIFVYVNNRRVKREPDEGRKALYPVYTVSGF